MDEGTSRFLDGARDRTNGWTNVHVSPPLRHDAEIFMPGTDNAHESVWIPSRPVGRATRP